MTPDLSTVHRIATYLSLIRFSHTLFALPFALLAAGMATKLNLDQTPPVWPRWMDGLGILLCMIFARSAAMGFNRWADRNIDAENPRTANRHIPAGLISSGNALIFVAANSIAFVGSTLLFLPNVLPIAAAVPVLLFLLGYSFAKRWTVAAHFWLGTALMLAPLAAWVVIRPVPCSLVVWIGQEIPWPAILLGLAVLFWSSGFDLIYATQDADHDARAGLFSVPGKFGVRTGFRIAALCHAIAVAFFAAIPLTFPPFGPIFLTGVMVVAGILLAEHGLAAPKAGKPLDLQRVNVAFFQMNIAVSLGLLSVGVLDLVF